MDDTKKRIQNSFLMGSGVCVCVYIASNFTSCFFLYCWSKVIGEREWWQKIKCYSHSFGQCIEGRKFYAILPGECTVYNFDIFFFVKKFTLQTRGAQFSSLYLADPVKKSEKVLLYNLCVIMSLKRWKKVISFRTLCNVYSIRKNYRVLC